MDARQVRRQRAAVDPTLPLLGRPILLLVGLCVVRRERRLDVLECQLHLLGVEPLGPAAELRAPELCQQVTKLIVLVGEPAVLRQRRVAVARQPMHQRQHGVEIVGERISRHDGI